MSNGREKHEYSKHEKKVIRIIREEYIRTIKSGKTEDKEDTPFDTVEVVPWYRFFYKTVAKLMPAEASMESLQFWVSQFTAGVCKEFAEYLLGQILEYQNQRKVLRWNSYAIDDPTSLLFDEFKKWLVTLSSYQVSDTQACLADIDKRIRYLNSLLARGEQLFPSGRNSVRNRQELLSMLVQTLEKSIAPYVKILPDLQTAREHFRLLTEESKVLLKRGIQTLYLVLRDQEDAVRYSLVYDELHESKKDSPLPLPTIRTVDRIPNTVTGSLIKTLVLQCKALKCKAETPGTKFITDELQISKAILDPELKSSSQTLITASEPSQELTIEHLVKGKKKSGIDKFFLDITDAYQNNNTNKRILTLFIELHFLLFEFAKISSIVEVGYDLAGVGGNLLLYGFLNEPTKIALENYQAVLEQINTHFEELDKLCFYRIQEDLRKRVQSPWRHNHHIMKEHLTLFKESRNKVENNLNSIKSVLHAVDLGDLLKEAKQKMERFANMVYEHRNCLHKKTSPALKSAQLPQNAVSVSASVPRISSSSSTALPIPPTNTATSGTPLPKINAPEKHDAEYSRAKSLWHKVVIANSALFEILKNAIQANDKKTLDDNDANNINILNVCLQNAHWTRESEKKSRFFHRVIHDALNREARKEITIIEEAISMANNYLEEKTEDLFDAHLTSFGSKATKLIDQIKSDPEALKLKQDLQSTFSSDEFYCIFTKSDEGERREKFKEYYDAQGKIYDEMIDSIHKDCACSNQAEIDKITESFKTTKGNREKMLAVRTSLSIQLEEARTKHRNKDKQQPMANEVSPVIQGLIQSFKDFLNKLKQRGGSNYRALSELAGEHLREEKAASAEEGQAIEKYIIDALCCPFKDVPLSYLKDKDCNTLMHHAMKSYKKADKDKTRNSLAQIIDLLYQNGADATTTNSAQENSYAFAGFQEITLDNARNMKKDETRKMWRLKSLEAKYLIAWSPLTEAVKRKLVAYIDQRREKVEGMWGWFVAWFKKLWGNHLAIHDRLVTADKLLQAFTESAGQLDDEHLMKVLQSSDMPIADKKSKLTRIAVEMQEKTTSGAIICVSQTLALQRLNARLTAEKEKAQTEKDNAEKESKENSVARQAAEKRAEDSEKELAKLRQLLAQKNAISAQQSHTAQPNSSSSNPVSSQGFFSAPPAPLQPFRSLAMSSTAREPSNTQAPRLISSHAP